MERSEREGKREDQYAMQGEGAGMVAVMGARESNEHGSQSCCSMVASGCIGNQKIISPFIPEAEGEGSAGVHAAHAGSKGGPQGTHARR